MTTTVLSVLDSVRGCKVAHIAALNAPTRLKKGHPFAHPVRCFTVKRVLIGVEYEWLVNSRIMLEGIAGKDGSPVAFTALPSWGDYKRRVDGSSLPYMEYAGPEGPYYLPNCPVEYLVTEYRLMDGTSDEGTPIPYATVAPWLPKKSEGTRQPNAVKVPWRKNGLKNILRVIVGETIAEGDSGTLAAKAAAGDKRAEAMIRLAAALASGDGATAKEIAAAFAPVMPKEVAG